jgi:acyl transferase domain-containing protein/NAD(P)-dependent dehydrogenase (short-subunit alcohol dehydrogenase family)/acyl carrier protein
MNMPEHDLGASLEQLRDELARSREENRRLLEQRHAPVAVVGIGVRVPGGSRTVEDFAAFLREGRSGIGPVPADRWDVEAFAARDPQERGRIQTDGGGFLDRIDLFDARFFNISPKEANFVDPQQRMLLETAWEALEHANLDPLPTRGGRGGVYVGGSSIDYAIEATDLDSEELDAHLAAGTTIFPLAGRISYVLGWRGPSMSVDTACASSLTAIHLAAAGLRNGECDLALAGGVNALHHPRIWVTFSHANMLAPDGRCKTFDEAADGYARAEGCGMLVLKRLADAQRDGDRIWAVISGTAVGQDGDSAGLTVPNGVAQEATIRAALADARLEPGDIQYVEAHGTGTPLGDPIELGAINDVFASSHRKQDPLLVGSVKTNLGHMEPAAGVIAVIKTVLQLQEQTIFPHLNLEQPSGRIPWDAYPIEIPRTGRPWAAERRRAVVNSFGFTGTIAAAVVEEPPAAPAPRMPGPAVAGRGAAPGAELPEPVFTLSAKDGRSLIRQAERYREFLRDRPGLDIRDVCYTANVGRSHFAARLAAPVADAEALRTLLDRQIAAGAKPGRRAERPVRKTAFLFAGQGSQYPGMGAALYRRHQAFRAAVDRCDELFAPLIGESVKALFLDPAADQDRLAETRFTQPALFALEYALARLWISWGVRPNVLIGHSIGEVVAAAVAGVFGLEDAVRLVAARARLMQSVTAPGGMLAVTAAVAEVEPLLAEYADLALAGVNAPTQCVVSGGADSLLRLAERLGGLGIRTKPLAVSHAFHSPLMAEVYDRFREEIAGIEFHAPAITLISNVTGKVAEAARLRTPEYWVAHIGAPVLFEAGMAAVARRGRHAMLEIGPSSALTSLARQCVPVDEHRWMTSLSRTDRDGTSVLRALAQLYTAGLPVSWPGVHADGGGRKITLPAYSFEQRRYWLPNQGRRHGLGAAAGHPLLGREVTGQAQRAAGEREFAASVDAAHPAYLADHVLLGRCVLPAGGYLEALFALQDAVFGETRRPVLGLQVREPLVFEEDRTVELRTRLRTAADGRTEVEFVSVAAADDQDEAAGDPRGGPGDPDRERLHATARLGPAEPDRDARPGLVRPPAAGTAVAERAGSDVYGALTDLGLDYGPRFRLLTKAARHQDPSGGAGHVAAELESRPVTAAEYFPPELFEAAAHAATAWAEGSIALLPVGFERAVLHRKPRSRRLVVTASAIERVADDLVADLVVADEDGRPVLELAGVRFTDASSVISGVQRPWYHEQRWVSRRAGAPVPRDRHVLLLGRGESWFAPIRARAEAVGVVLSVARDLDEAAAVLTGPRPVTDLWWHWRGSGRIGVPAFREDAERNYRELLELAALLDKEGFGRDQRLWLLTERGQFVPGDPAERLGDAMAASLWGFGHVLLNEHPAFRTTLVDLPEPQADPLLLDELLAPDADEFQVCFRGGRRKVRRMFPCAPTVPSEPGFELRTRAPEGEQDPAGFGGLESRPAEDRAPGRGEIQVLVHAAVLTAQDLGADPAAPLGPRAAGTVLAAGPDAVFRVGDEVLVEAPGCLRRRITVPQAAAVRKPAGPDFAAAAASAPGVEVFTLDELDEAADAARRDGAAVLDLLAHRPRPAREVRLRPDRGYLVTGGLGGLGLVAARKLAAQGARHLLLVGRRAPSPQQQAEFDAGFDGLAEVRYLRGDIADPADVDRIFAELAASGRPVGGIVHTAGVLADGPVSAQTWETIDTVFGAKVYGTWLLHEAAQRLPDLDFLVGYSSAAAGLGGVTQSNYAAANAFMDNVMRWRALRGLPGLSINWGPWSQIGMSSRLTPQIMRAWEDQGISFFTPERGTSALVSLLGAPIAQVGFGQCDWPRFVSNKPVANALYQPVLGAAGSERDGFDLDAVLRLEGAPRGEALEALVLAELGRVLRVADPEDLDPDTEFLNLGLDSLMAMELRAALQGALRTPLPASVAFDHPTTVALADFLAVQLTARPAAAPRTEHPQDA